MTIDALTEFELRVLMSMVYERMLKFENKLDFYQNIIDKLDGCIKEVKSQERTKVSFQNSSFG